MWESSIIKRDFGCSSFIEERRLKKNKKGGEGGSMGKLMRKRRLGRRTLLLWERERERGNLFSLVFQTFWWSYVSENWVVIDQLQAATTNLRLGSASLDSELLLLLSLLLLLLVCMVPEFSFFLVFFSLYCWKQFDFSSGQKLLLLFHPEIATTVVRMKYGSTVRRIVFGGSNFLFSERLVAVGGLGSGSSS